MADCLGLAPATISLVMNRAPIADTIAPETKQRIFEAAQTLGYRPHFLARCLRSRRTFTIGVLTPEVTHGYNTTVLSGMEDHLLQAGYFYLVASHRFQPDLIAEYPKIFLHRSVDGLIVLNAPWKKELPIPVVTISCHHAVKRVSRIILDHEVAAELALEHLWGLGHREIAVIRGQSVTADSLVRWSAILKVAEAASRPIDEELVAQMEELVSTPGPGYRVTQKLLSSGKRFTALFAFNDIAAIGAIRAIHEYGLRVPQDISVIGFDDIASAAYQHPGLTTVRQPLRQMGRRAAEIVLKRIDAKEENVANEIVFEPELIVRGTTGPAKANRALSIGNSTSTARD